MSMFRSAIPAGAFVLATALFLLSPVFAAAADGDKRPVITVLDFKASGVSQAEVEVFIDYLSAQIVETELYRVIDRAQRELLLQEQQFSTSECSDEECLLQVGKLLAANRIVVGSLGKVGSRFLLNVKLVEVETGETVRTASEKYDSLDALIDDSARLAKEFVAKGAPAVASVTTPVPAQAPAAPKVEEPKAEPPKADVVPKTADDETKPAAAAPAEPEGEVAKAAPAQRRGLSLEPQGGALFVTSSPFVEVGAALVYQFGNRFSLGLWGGWYIGGSAPSLGLRLVFGNKVDGFALLLDLGIAPGVGLYYRGFLAALEVLPAGGLGLGLRAGYSIFLGRK